MVEAAFKGFQALPAPDQVISAGVNFFLECDTDEEIKRRYKHLVKELHPDTGGNPEEFSEMTRQYNQRK